MITYTTADEYITSASTLEDRITKIGQVISAMEDMMLKAAATGQFQDYWLDTGQTRIKTTYRDINVVTAAYQNFLKIEQMLIGRLNRQNNGSTTKLIDDKNITGCL
jgi:hypothetical protein